MDLREQLRECFAGRVCLMGLGNVEYGDDGFGVRLADALVPDAGYTIILAGTSPERFIGRAGDDTFAHVIFLDAVDFGGVPGEVVFLNAEKIAARFPQISTHKISLGLLAKSVEANGRTKAWLLGVQPQSLKPGEPLSPAVKASLELLRELLTEVSTEVIA